MLPGILQKVRALELTASNWKTRGGCLAGFYAAGWQVFKSIMNANVLGETLMDEACMELQQPTIKHSLRHSGKGKGKVHAPRHDKRRHKQTRV